MAVAEWKTDIGDEILISLGSGMLLASLSLEESDCSWW